jgi:hypothetical protein
VKKLLIAIFLLVLATLTETPDEYIITGSGNPSQVDAYLSAWANAEAEGVIAEDPDSFSPLSEVRTDQVEIDKDAHVAI